MHIILAYTTISLIIMHYLKGLNMTTTNRTVNVRINDSTHDDLKALCDKEGMLLGRLVDKVLTKHIHDWKTNIDADQKTSIKKKSD